MASSAGSSGVFKISQTDGSETAVAEVRSYSLDVTADTIEKSVMGNTARAYLAGLSSSTLSVEAYWDQSDQDAFDELAHDGTTDVTDEHAASHVDIPRRKSG